MYNCERFLEVSETIVVWRDEKINQINIIIGSLFCDQEI